MAQSVDSTTCPDQLTTMSDLSNPNGNARPQRKCKKRIYEGYEMTKITKPIKTMKGRRRKCKKPLLNVDNASYESERPSNVCVTRRRKCKKPLLNVDNASYESERPSNVCVTQPNNCEVNVQNNLDHSVAQPNNCEVNVQNNLDHSVAQPNNCEVNVQNNLDHSVAQPNNCEVNVQNNLDHSVAQPNNCEVNVQNNLDHSVAQPNNCEVNVQNNLDHSVAQPNNCEVNVQNNLDHSVAQPNNCEVNVQNNLDHSVAQPNNREVNVQNNLDHSVAQPNNRVVDVINLDDYDDNNGEENVRNMNKRDYFLKLYKQRNYESLLSDRFQYIPTIEDNNIFPGYNQQVFLQLKHYLMNKKVNNVINRIIGACTFEHLARVFVPGAWLDDNIIQHYFELLRKNCSNNVYICTSYIFNDLQRYGIDGFVERFMKGIKLLSYSKMLVPTHINDHWALIVVEIKERKIVCYDSLDYYEFILEKMKMLKTLLEQKYFMQQEDYSSTIKICSGISPKQNNKTDCGVFTCINAAHIMYNKPLNYTQMDIPLFRHKILCEIVSSKLIITE